MDLMSDSWIRLQRNRIDSADKRAKTAYTYPSTYLSLARRRPRRLEITCRLRLGLPWPPFVPKTATRSTCALLHFHLLRIYPSIRPSVRPSACPSLSRAQVKLARISHINVLRRLKCHAASRVLDDTSCRMHKHKHTRRAGRGRS